MLSRPAIVINIVVFPIPEGPSRQTVSPSVTIFHEQLLALVLSLTEEEVINHLI